MRKWLIGCSLALAAIGGPRAVAADVHHQFAIRGAGALSCRLFSEVKPAELGRLRMAVDDFSMGYISALNRVTPNTYDVLPLTEPGLMASWVQAVCKAQPNQQIESVVFGILHRVSALKVTEKSPEVVAANAHESVLVEKATLVAVQRALIRKGLLKGDADGRFSADVAAALMAYQHQVSLAATGLPDGPTVVRLLVAEAKPGHGGNKKAWWHFW